MTVTTENLIRALLSNSDEVMFGELSVIHALERLFESDEARIPQEELSNDLSKIFEVSERMIAVKSLSKKLDIYYSEYRPLSSELKAKYSDFFAGDSFKEIEYDEKSMDGIIKLMIALGMLLALEEEIDEVQQYEKLYMGMLKLSEILEEYLFYFSPDLIEYVKNITLAFLNDTTIKLDKANQKDSAFSYLFVLKSTTRAVLWQIEENRTQNKKLHFIDSPSHQRFTQKMQIQKNLAAMDWANSRLEQMESIGEEKGWKF